MGKQKNVAKGGGKAPSTYSSTLSSHVGEAGDPCDTVQDLRDKVASLEEALSQMGASCKCPFNLHNIMDCCQNGPYHWSAELIPQQMKTRNVIVPMLE